VARNRKRAKDRRSRRPSEPSPSRPGVATAREAREDGAPDPIEHATPDVELAEAQLALGRPELIGEPEVPDEEPAELDDELDGEDDFTGLEPGGGGGRAGRASRGFDGEGLPGGGGGEVAVPAPRAKPGTRVINFLQGSWRELQRVQWPDRRQVIQATGVVIGFVIVAGVFLGVADTLAGHIMNYVLTGKW
jgi:preprotein translocase subunit SecE